MLRVAHVWLGLTFGFIWALQGLTGAFLVFHRELDRLALSTQPTVTPLPLDRLIAAAQERSATPSESIGVLDGEPSILAVNFTDPAGARRGILLDAASGAILQDRNWRPRSPLDGSFTRWIYNLHHQFLSGETGELLLGASGLLLFTSAGWGVYLGWPRRKHWHVFAVANWHSRLRRLFGWHRATGLCAAIILLILALTGASMDFGKQLRTFSQNNLPYERPFKVGPGRIPEHPIAAQQALTIAQVEMPGAAFVSLSLPSDRKPAYQVRMRQPREWRSWSGTSMVTIDARNGDVLNVYDATKAPVANRAIESAFSLHSGEVAGFAGRLIVMLAGLSLPGLYVTGLWAWLYKRRRRRDAVN